MKVRKGKTKANSVAAKPRRGTVGPSLPSSREVAAESASEVIVLEIIGALL